MIRQFSQKISKTGFEVVHSSYYNIRIQPLSQPSPTSFKNDTQPLKTFEIRPGGVFRAISEMRKFSKICPNSQKMFFENLFQVGS